MIFSRIINSYKEILHTWISGYLELLTPYSRRLISPESIKKKFWKVTKSLVRSFLLIFKKSSKIPKDTVWLYVTSVNNYNSLKFLSEEIDDTIFISPKLFYAEQEFHKYSAMVSYNLKFFHNLIFPIHLLILSFTSTRKKFLKNFDLVFDAIGVIQESERILRKYKPRAIIFANDHSIPNRSMLLAAKKLKVKTIYLQHASVSKYFPPLKFDLSLLEGEDALSKYREIGIHGAVELVGMPKLDPYVKFQRVNSGVSKVGICYNLTDSINDIVLLVKSIGEFSFELFLRPHPGDERSTENFQIPISDSKSETAFDFLKKVDLIISGDSSILLEAALLNVHPVYYKYSDGPMSDYYGFVKNNLVRHAKNKHELISLLQHLKSNDEVILPKAKYYNSTVGTKYFGKSSTLAIEQIKKVLKNSNV